MDRCRPANGNSDRFLAHGWDERLLGGTCVTHSRHEPVGPVSRRAVEARVCGALSIGLAGLALVKTLHLDASGDHSLTRIDRYIRSFDIRPKHHRRTGLQLADLVVSPIGRYVLGKPTRPDWEIVRDELLHAKGRWLGPGVMILPK